jgi:hypothetical protein
MKMLAGFVLRFVIVFGLLAWPWPGLRNAVAAGFRAQTRLLVQAMRPRESLRVVPLSDPRYPNLDTLVVLTNQKEPGGSGQPSAAEIAFDSASQGWTPFAMLIALSLATPVPCFQRLKALLAGVLVIQLLVAVTILVGTGFALMSDDTPAWSRLLLIFANHLFIQNIWFSFVPPFLFWAGWLAWSGHWTRLGRRLTGGQESGQESLRTAVNG